MRNTLFADSGGSGTDWIYINNEGNKVVYETESYHPCNWGDSFWKGLENYWNSKQHLLKYNLRFFGAGCLNNENAELLRNKFLSIGFTNVEVKSDLHAAGYACYQNGEGIVIISGTGSVMFSYSNGEVGEITGGKGHEDGDEGSGFYFGKLIIEKYQQKALSAEQLNLLHEKVDLQSLSKTNPSQAKSIWSSLSKELEGEKQLFTDIHKENIVQFIESHFQAGVPKKVCLVGSYAYHHKELWQEELTPIGCEIEQVIHKPIMHFIE